MCGCTLRIKTNTHYIHVYSQTLGFFAELYTDTLYIVYKWYLGSFENLSVKNYFLKYVIKCSKYWKMTSAQDKEYT